MQELVKIAVNLLSEHTCVIVPDFGGFVVNDKWASVNPFTGHFFPPQKEIIFNAHLTHNDGLLAYVFMQQANLSLDEAHKIIAERVESVKKELNATKKYELDDWGHFSLEEGRVRFHPGKIQIENKDAAGLKEFYFPAITSSAQRLPSGKTAEKSPAFSKIMIGGIAAAFGLFLLCQPIRNESSSDYASLIPLKSISENMLAAELSEKEKTLKEVREAPTKINYYLVADEFETETDALQYMQEMKMKPNDCLELLPAGTKYYVTIVVPEAVSEKKDADKLTYVQARYPQLKETFILGLQQ